jgi:hypothetical protein
MTIDSGRRMIGVLLIVMSASALYFRVSLTYFCGYDDFMETRRADLVDRVNPRSVYTTTHFDSFKYRPLNRAATLVTYLTHPGDALPFRLRNLAFHELAGVEVYALALILFESWPAACLAGLLFVLHPLANQSVDAAVWTNTTANALFLGSLLLFLLGMRRRNLRLLLLASLCSAIDVLLYEAAIMLPVLMSVWWAIDCLANKRWPRFREPAVFVFANCSLFGTYLLFRQHIVHGARVGVTPPLSILKGLAEDAGALLLPFDLVLANTWFHTPLPSELRANGIGKIALIAAAVIIALLVFALFKYRKALAACATEVGWPNFLLLTSAMALSILPLVLFSEHVSETYLYLPLAFFCILLGRLLTLIPSVPARCITVVLVLFMFCCATWVRNERVRTCGVEAALILSTLAAAPFHQGTWQIDVAKTPGTITPLHFGLYNYRGLDTLGSGDPGLGEFGLRGVEAAVQMKARNPRLSVTVHSAVDLRTVCAHPAPNQACFWVAPSGTVAPFR